MLILDICLFFNKWRNSELWMLYVRTVICLVICTIEYHTIFKNNFIIGVPCMPFFPVFTFLFKLIDIKQTTCSPLLTFLSNFIYWSFNERKKWMKLSKKFLKGQKITQNVSKKGKCDLRILKSKKWEKERKANSGLRQRILKYLQKNSWMLFWFCWIEYFFRPSS